MEILKERCTYDEIVIAGTSANAAALSTPIIYSGKSDGGFLKGDVYVTTSLEFMREVAIDRTLSPVAEFQEWRRQLPLIPSV